MKLVLSRLALAELDAILAYIAERSPLGAEHVEVRVRRAFAHIARYPEAAGGAALTALALSLCHLLRDCCGRDHDSPHPAWCPPVALVGRPCGRMFRSEARDATHPTRRRGACSAGSPASVSPGE